MLNVKTSTNTKTTLKVNTAGVLTAISEGTYTAIQAMYEFIDNSLDANGKNIRVGVYENNRCRGGTNVQSLVISDDGAGGNPAELQEALSRLRPGRRADDCHKDPRRECYRLLSKSQADQS